MEEKTKSIERLTMITRKATEAIDNLVVSVEEAEEALKKLSEFFPDSGNKYSIKQILSELSKKLNHDK